MTTIPRNWIFFALLIHVIAAWYSLGHYHDDEYHQILAFTASKIGLADSSELRWEYESQLRTGFQPYIAFLLKKPLMYAGLDSPFLHAFILRLLSGFLSLAALVLLIRAITPELQDEKIKRSGIYYLLFLWLQVFINVRFSSEGWATSLFILGLSLYLININRSNRMSFLIGFIFGLAFISRYQVGLMLAGFGLWMIVIQHEKLTKLAPLIFGGIAALAIGIACDWWLYNELVFTAWNYLNVNLLQGRVETFTHEPWWYYTYYSAVQILPPITLVLPVFIIFFWILFRKHPITWITIPFVLFHHYLGHKEMRFLFPVLPFAPLIYVFVIEKIKTTRIITWPPFLLKFWHFIFFIALVLNTLLLILVLFLPASKETVMWEKCLSKINNADYSNILTYDAGELDMHFYNTQRLKIVSISEAYPLEEAIHNNNIETIYFASRKTKHLKNLEDSNIQYEMVCKSFPDWLMSLNFNNWTSRASLWRLWKLHPIPKT